VRRSIIGVREDAVQDRDGDELGHISDKKIRSESGVDQELVFGKSGSSMSAVTAVTVAIIVHD
jgi:hypothetical protein